MKTVVATALMACRNALDETSLMQHLVIRSSSRNQLDVSGDAKSSKPARKDNNERLRETATFF